MKIIKQTGLKKGNFLNKLSKIRSSHSRHFYLNLNQHFLKKLSIDFSGNQTLIVRIERVHCDYLVDHHHALK